MPSPAPLLVLLVLLPLAALAASPMRPLVRLPRLDVEIVPGAEVRFPPPVPRLSDQSDDCSSLLCFAPASRSLCSEDFSRTIP